MTGALSVYGDPTLVGELVDLTRDAGRAVMEIYEGGDRGVELKPDQSPVTAADLEAHRVLTAGLTRLTPQVRIVSEEDPASLNVPRDHELFWLIDPLDGTKEFISRNGDFTCNVALVESGRPVLGLVGVPVDGRVFVGGPDVGAEVVYPDGSSRSIRCRAPGDVLTVVASRSHLSSETSAYLDRLGTDVELVSVGSSLKFLLIAEGAADLYPRMAPTCEWDTAAAHAVLEGAGGAVEAVDGTRLVYGKDDILNPWFVAYGLRQPR